MDFSFDTNAFSSGDTQPDWEKSANAASSSGQFPWATQTDLGDAFQFDLAPLTSASCILSKRNDAIADSITFNCAGSVLWMTNKRTVRAYDTVTGRLLGSNALEQRYDICAIVRTPSGEREWLLLYKQPYTHDKESYFDFYIVTDTYGLELDERIYGLNNMDAEVYTTIRASPSGRHLILSGATSSIYLWDCVKRKRRGPLVGSGDAPIVDHRGRQILGNASVVDVDFFSDHEAASVCEDGSLCVWDVASGACKATFTIDKASSIETMVCLPSFNHQRRILVGSGSSSLQRFVLKDDMFVADPDGTLDGFNRDANFVAYSRSCDVVAFGKRLTFLTANVYAPALKTIAEQLIGAHVLFTVAPLVDLVGDFLRPVKHSHKQEQQGQQFGGQNTFSFDFAPVEDSEDSAAHNSEEVFPDVFASQASNTMGHFGWTPPAPNPKQKVLSFEFRSSNMQSVVYNAPPSESDEEDVTNDDDVLAYEPSSRALPPSCEFAGLNLDFGAAFPSDSSSSEPKK